MILSLHRDCKSRKSKFKKDRNYNWKQLCLYTPTTICAGKKKKEKHFEKFGRCLSQSQLQHIQTEQGCRSQRLNFHCWLTTSRRYIKKFSSWPWSFGVELRETRVMSEPQDTSPHCTVGQVLKSIKVYSFLPHELVCFLAHCCRVRHMFNDQVFLFSSIFCVFCTHLVMVTTFHVMVCCKVKFPCRAANRVEARSCTAACIISAIK